MNTRIPVIVSKDNSYYTVQVLFYPAIQKGNYKEWEAFYDIEEAIRKLYALALKKDDTEILEQLLYSPHCEINHFHIKAEFRKKIFDLWLPVVYWSEGDSHYLLCPFLEGFQYMHNDATLLSKTVEYYFQCWMRAENNDLPNDEFETLTQKLTDRFQKKHYCCIRLINVNLQEKLDCVWLKDGSQTEAMFNLQEIAEPIVFMPHTYEELAYPGDYVITPSNDKLKKFYDCIKDSLTDKNHRKCILIVGQELTGRSLAIETALRTIQRDINYRMNENCILVPDEDHIKNKVWKLSGSGIISGMSQAGQWEARAESLFSCASNKDLILYFESLLELTEAGKSSSGKLSVADALLVYMKEKKIRVVSKITPTQLVKLRERNRSFVNQFEILTMPVLSAVEQLQIYISQIQQWNNIKLAWENLKTEESASNFEKWKSIQQSHSPDSFDHSPFEIIPYLTQLVEWTNPSSGAPGSVCKWLDKVSVLQSNNSDNSSGSVQDSLLSQMGANFPLLKNDVSPNYREIKEKLSDQVIGQEEAIDALTNWTLKFQALLSDPGRPAASMLFLGPTGVGKTESAKAVARFLYNDEHHFLRIDCNELNSAYAVSRLVGTTRSEGSLTNAVRLQPFSVVLFDEIEKAHPSFHDLLLQILGEGRLTDGKGRTTSFKNCFIILTSNLGANQAGHFTGFGNVYQNDRDIYFKAVKDFFRPEFINRLDIVVPFNRLGNAELEIIAQKFIDQICSREGFQKRKALLSISPPALDWLIQQGHDSKYGARQTQRSLERILVEPLSAFFARTTWNSISVIEIGCNNENLTFSISSIAPSKKPQGVFITSDMLKDTTTNEYNVFYKAFLDWSRQINSLFASSQSANENVVLDWENIDEFTRFQYLIQEELDSLKNDLELVATISESALRNIEQKLNRYILNDSDSKVQKIPAPQSLSLEEWNLLLQSESGVFTRNVKLSEIDPERFNIIIDSISKCSRIYQLLASGIPQPEEALIMFFSTGMFTNDVQLDLPIVRRIHQFADNSYSPMRLKQDFYNSPQRGKILYFQAQGLGAYQQLMNFLSGSYVMFDDYGHLSRADSVVILPFDSKQQTPDKCIENYLNSDASIWGELRYMYTEKSFYESLDVHSNFDLPPELAQVLLQIIH